MRGAAASAYNLPEGVVTIATLRRMLTAYDIGLGLLILVAGLVSLYWVGTAGAAGAGVLAVEIDGRVVKEVEYHAADPPRLIKVSAPRGEITIELREGQARILPLPTSTCPLGICWNSGWTNQPAKSIVCLPNRLVMRVRHANTDIDGLTR